MANARKNIMKEIIEKINKFDNEEIYLKIFDKLTRNDTCINYTCNSNGIFFNLKDFTMKAFIDINDSLDAFKEVNELSEKAENLRSEKIVEIKRSLNKRIPAAESREEILENLKEGLDSYESQDEDLFGDCDSEQYSE